MERIILASNDVAVAAPMMVASENASIQQDQNGSKSGSVTAKGEGATLMALPVEIRNQIYCLALSHDKHGGVIAPMALEWERQYDGRGCWTIVKGKEEHVTSRGDFEETATGYQPTYTYTPYLVTEKSKNATTYYLETRPLRDHVCSMPCLSQPAITRVSR